MPAEQVVRIRTGGSDAARDAPSPACYRVPAWDELFLPVANRRALGDVVARHAQVRRLVTGHVHGTITADFTGRAVLSLPSTNVQARLTLGSDEIELTAEPVGFAVHAVRDGEVVSYIHRVD